MLLLVRKRLISAGIAENIRSWKHSEFSVWIGEQIRPEDADSRRFIARYICRSPISLQKLCIDHDTITINTENKGHAEFEDGPEFLARLQMHLPSRYESLIRRFGQWSYRKCKARSASDDTATITPLSEQVTKKQLSRSWVQLINKIYEIDPLRCQRCNGEMAFKQFLCGQAQTKSALAQFGIAPFKAPPPLRSPPASGESIDENIDYDNLNQEHWAE